MTEIKTTSIQVRVTEEDKENAKKVAKAKGFDTVSAWFLYEVRKAAKTLKNQG